jgi:hypothetical protein
MSMERPTSFRLPSRPQAGVPRRFGIATIMILTAVFGLLCGALRMLDVTSAGFVGISIFVAGIAVCQALLFKGKNPRAASMIGGAVIFYLIMVVVCFTNDFGPHDFTKEMTFSFGGTLLTLAIGGFVGYLVGALIAAVFLVRKEPIDIPPQPPTTSDHDLPRTGEAKGEMSS